METKSTITSVDHFFGKVTNQTVQVVLCLTTDRVPAVAQEYWRNTDTVRE